VATADRLNSFFDTGRMPPSPRMNAQRFKGEVWVVEDDVDLSRTIVDVLGRSAYDARAFGSVEEALARVNLDGTVRVGRPGCLLLDVKLPGIDGIDAQSYLRQRLGAALPIIFMSGQVDAAGVNRAWKEGAFDFLLKPFSKQELLTIVHRCFDAAPALPSELKGASVVEREMPVHALSPRERQVLALVAGGNASKVICRLLSISLPTVKMHRGNVMRKLGLKNMADLVRFYDQHRTRLDVH